MANPFSLLHNTRGAIIVTEVHTLSAQQPLYSVLLAPLHKSTDALGQSNRIQVCLPPDSVLAWLNQILGVLQVQISLLMSHQGSLLSKVLG